MNRGDAAAGTWIIRGETGRGDAAAATQIIRGDAVTPRPRRGYSVETRRCRDRGADIPWRPARAAAATRIFRGDRRTPQVLSSTRLLAGPGDRPPVIAPMSWSPVHEVVAHVVSAETRVGVVERTFLQNALRLVPDDVRAHAHALGF